MGAQHDHPSSHSHQILQKQKHTARRSKYQSIAREMNPTMQAQAKTLLESHRDPRKAFVQDVLPMYEVVARQI